MISLLARAAGLTGVYLLVLSSVAAGDVLVGGALALAIAWALRPAGARGGRAPLAARLRATGAVVGQTAVEMAVGSWRVVGFCLGAPARPGLVEIPRSGRSRRNVAMWGVLTGEAPDEVVVDVDEVRDVLIVHLVDAGDPAAVRARHRRNLEHGQGRVIP